MKMKYEDAGSHQKDGQEFSILQNAEEQQKNEEPAAGQEEYRKCHES